MGKEAEESEKKTPTVNVARCIFRYGISRFHRQLQ
jgi:hypothetical protein